MFPSEFKKLSKSDGVGTPTPWGPTTRVVVLAEGIFQHETAAHGGIYLHPVQNAKVPEYMRLVSRIYQEGEGWYEEDEEWAKVAIVFPEAFGERVKTAEWLMQEWFPEEWKRFVSEQPNSTATPNNRI